MNFIPICSTTRYYSLVPPGTTECSKGGGEEVARPGIFLLAMNVLICTLIIAYNVDYFRYLSNQIKMYSIRNKL